MSDELVFMMGEFEAKFPTDRKYAKNHMWAKSQGDQVQFGFSAYAVRLLQDVYFLDWIVEPGTALLERQEIGSVESKKAESDLYSPVSGTLTQINQQLMADPSTINVDKYGEGWLIEIQGDEESLMSPSQYIEHLDAVWEVTQRTIKGQLND